jgi:hypothetical protein
MTDRAKFFESLIAPALWVIGVVSICIFAHHDPAGFKADIPQSAVLTMGEHV